MLRQVLKAAYAADCTKPWNPVLGNKRETIDNSQVRKHKLVQVLHHFSKALWSRDFLIEQCPDRLRQMQQNMASNAGRKIAMVQIAPWLEALTRATGIIDWGSCCESAAALRLRACDRAPIAPNAVSPSAAGAML